MKCFFFIMMFFFIVPPIPAADLAGDTVTASTVSDSFCQPEFSAEQSSRSISLSSTTLRIFREAEQNYRYALAFYEQGDLVNGNTSYWRALQALGEASSEAPWYRMLDESLEKVFQKLRVINSDKENEESERRSASIPLDMSTTLVENFVRRYSEGIEKLELRKALERSGKYRGMIGKILKEYRLPPELVYLPVVESLYINTTCSRAGALGLWQLMPARARHLGLKINYWIDERKDTEKSTRAAARYLRELYTLFDDWHLALAAYNRGEYGLMRDMESVRSSNFELAAQRGAVPKETEYFVPRFIAVVIAADRYDSSVSYEPEEAYDEVVIDEAIDLGIVARCASSSVHRIRELNPAIKAWCTPPRYTGFRLKLPSGTKDIFLANIARVEDLNPSPGHIKYTVASGECLSGIAERFRTTASAIQRDNKIKDPGKLKAGQILMVRPGKTYLAAGAGTPP